MSTFALPTLRQALRQRPSSVCTAGPQPGTFPAQCAPLDLNLGPAQLSVHRWTSTWDLPGSVCTAGSQPGTCPAQCALLDLNGQIECQKICHRTVPKHLATLAIEYRRPYGYCLERAAHHRTQTCPKRLGLYGPRKESPTLGWRPSVWKAWSRPWKEEGRWKCATGKSG